MKFITEIQKQRLLHNGSFEQKDQDHAPVVKLFLPNTNATWLLSELEPENEHIAFGLCDLGMGFPELGFVDLEELDALRGKYCMPVEQDLSFEAKYPMSVYAHAARMEQLITTKEELLSQVAIDIAKPHKSPHP